MQHVLSSARLAGQLARWHGGAAIAVLASRLAAGGDVSYADPDVARAVGELGAQKIRHLDHVGRGNDDAAIRADAE